MKRDDYRDERPCSCHISPPCESCVSAPDWDVVSHEADVREADEDDGEEGWWQALPGGFVHNQRTDVWHRGGSVMPNGVVQPECGHRVRADESCWFDECCVGVTLCPKCERLARVKSEPEPTPKPEADDTNDGRGWIPYYTDPTGRRIRMHRSDGTSMALCSPLFIGYGTEDAFGDAPECEPCLACEAAHAAQSKAKAYTPHRWDGHDAMPNDWRWLNCECGASTRNWVRSPASRGAADALEYFAADGTLTLLTEGMEYPSCARDVPCPGKPAKAAPEPTPEPAPEPAPELTPYPYLLDRWFASGSDPDDPEKLTAAGLLPMYALHAANAQWLRDTTPPAPVEVQRDCYDALLRPAKDETAVVGPVRVRT